MPTLFCRITLFVFTFGTIGAALAYPADAAKIDRRALVGRHDVRVAHVDPESALSVGNGDFAFTVDATGLQTFETLHFEKGLPLETLSTWAWHSFPNPQGLRLEDSMEPYPFHGRTVKYASLQSSAAGEYFRANPHPIPLGQIALLLHGAPVAPESLSKIDQRLELWTGLVVSRYVLAGETVEVETAADTATSTVAVKIRSALLRSGALTVRFRFPYSHDLAKSRNKPPLVWDRPDDHRTRLAQNRGSQARLARTLDDSAYAVTVRWNGAGKFTQAAAHDFRLAAKKSDTLAFACRFSPATDKSDAPTFDAVRTAGAAGWENYWTSGAAVDFSGSTDPRAAELERRVVLSQYLMRVNYAGDVPPAETGLAHISWYGKHNSEMYFWHAAHFQQWGRTHGIPVWLQKGRGESRKRRAEEGLEA